MELKKGVIGGLIAGVILGLIISIMIFIIVKSPIAMWGSPPKGLELIPIFGVTLLITSLLGLLFGIIFSVITKNK